MAKPLVILIVGHEAAKPGATILAPKKTTEYQFNTKLAGLIGTYLEKHFRVLVCFRDGLGIVQTYKEVDNYKPDYVLELHTNSAEDARAYGTETLCAESDVRFAKHIQRVMEQVLGRTGKGCRGVKVVPPGGRGYHSVIALPDAANALIEPFFGSNEHDCILFDVRAMAFCQAIAEGILMWEQGQHPRPGGSLQS